MKTKSAKQKARTLQNLTTELLRTTFPELQDHINPAIMGEGGRDIKLSPVAEEKIPFDIECKNRETISLWQFWKQCEANTKPDRIPLLVVKRNRSEPLAIMRLSDLKKPLSSGAWRQ